MNFEPEKSVPATLTKKHIGLNVLCRLPHRASLTEGTINALSPEGRFLQVGAAWVPNIKGHVLAILSKPPAKKRKTAF